MQIEVLKSKIHCATVTEANLNYMGSITIDENLLDAADMIAGQKVQIVDNNNGERFETYIIKGERGSGCVCLNGAAARKVQVGDVIIIIAYALMDFEEAKTFQPRIVFPNEQNRIWGFEYSPTRLLQVQTQHLPLFSMIAPWRSIFWNIFLMTTFIHHAINHVSQLIISLILEIYRAA